GGAEAGRGAQRTPATPAAGPRCGERVLATPGPSGTRPRLTRTAVIEFQQVTKADQVAGREIPARHSTDLTIEAGRVFGIIGHSGAGKSTLLRLINRLEEPSSGHIRVNGEDVTALDAVGLR